MTINKMLEFFNECGGTDSSYLRSHYKRFDRTFKFAHIDNTPAKLLDVGCHWLHLSYLFAKEGYKVTACDAPNTLRQLCVKNAAEKLGIKLLEYTRLDLGQGLSKLENDCYDLIIMSEIIEHLAFNPLVLWSELYRVLKTNGRIIITTPNSVYYKRVIKSLNCLREEGQFGCSIKEILYTGTYGHHWKEYSIKEIKEYFGEMGCGFSLSRYSIETHGIDVENEMHSFNSTCNDEYIRNLLAHLNSSGHHPFGEQIYAEIALKKGPNGFTMKPPWYIE